MGLGLALVGAQPVSQRAQHVGLLLDYIGQAVVLEGHILDPLVIARFHDLHIVLLLDEGLVESLQRPSQQERILRILSSECALAHRGPQLFEVSVLGEVLLHEGHFDGVGAASQGEVKDGLAIVLLGLLCLDLVDEPLRHVVRLSVHMISVASEWEGVNEVVRAVLLL